MSPRPSLVTGAAGFAGRHLVEHLLEHESHVIAWAHPGGRGIPADAPRERVTWLAVDVTDPGAVARALDEAPPGAVYHCAGIADVQSAWKDPARALRVNVMGTHHLLQALGRTGHEAPVLVTGSALVYAPSVSPLDETSPLGPANPYAISKLAQEMRAFAAAGDVIVARPFNHAGPRQSDSYVTSSFARQIAEAEAGVRPPALRVGNLDARRDLTDVRDTVRAYRLLVNHGRRGVPYNVCRGEAFRVGDLLDALVQRARVPIAVELDPARLRPSDNPVVLGSAARIRGDTGWEASIPVEQTLSDLLEDWRRTVSAGK